ncbi:MAG: hypothetical protein PUD31_02205 [Solobacterium sp.]|nr:hypothetical protein [Solobacterium sp.]MDY2952675.1 hypothetical protein [Erysipelotrichaceae bacterium]MCI6697496.1 hypothetical protein [Solobacterium sp.]MCI7156082.1 hypothetical protein [Solobacterium sp.]MDD5801220.1 hypothetical protein [Solobacterium sp.]
MLKYKFSNREIILLLIAVMLGLGLVYYSVILKSYNENVSKYDTTNLETELAISEAKLTKYENMKSYIDQCEDVYVGSVVSYDNIVNLFYNFSDVLDGKVKGINITVGDPIELETIVRRDVTISFIANNNEIVNNILSYFEDCEYRVIINKVQVSSKEDGYNLNNSGEVNASIVLTFFETTKDAKYNYGLVSQGQ